PGSPTTTWLAAKIYTHPERMNEIIAEHLPSLLTALGTDSCWWLRYRSPQETDHLRLRIRSEHACVDKIGEWAQRLRQANLAGRLAFDTYYPENGRYGSGPAMEAAEAVFVADSAVVAASLAKASGVRSTALVVANMVGIVKGFLGESAAMNWLVNRPAPATPSAERALADEAITLALGPVAPEISEQHWHSRTDALTAYRRWLSTDVNQDGVLESLLHMHHNRAIGIDPAQERSCRRLARQAAYAWQAQQAAGARG
ncbi:lantibiotic dehydratase, partial [Amycolatopsis rhizosphaerae]